MKVVAVESYVVKLRPPEAYLGVRPSSANGDSYYVRPPWRSLYSDRFETLIVRVTCDDGITGWGEALAPVAPEIAQAVVDRLVTPVLIGQDPRRVRPLWTTLTGLMRERGHLGGHQADALAAVDIALWDLAGKAYGVPVHALLGGAYRDDIPTYVSGLPRSTDGERAELASEWVSKGVRAIKLHLGNGVDEDLATFDAVQSVHPELKVAVDAHWAYALADALRLGQGLDERGAWFLEAPLVPEDLAAHRELAAALRTPVAVGEAMRHRFEFRAWLEARAVDLCQPDVGRTGITEAMAIAEIAAAHHIPVAPHHSVGLGVAVAAGLHVSAAIEAMPAFEFQPTTMTVANRILTAPLVGGPVSFALPQSPGLGVEVDPTTLQEEE
ncbi:MAG: mandelate racemase/muconate lactonizing enzyme family protein [Hamadaea sp.]|uniref:mandelate racemase/muconate lactonizing enzyme family protein n=1 Tax=Hamadaea sp. TaxID=2024425 RepID=UPI0017C7F543|nr:mandelate racemase/muconate lactonizing enzyme family protein [Hamadaea sp.]NUR72303.1 mandelate racemase/muconate lactonizing enzyme family protein [Hamadaea sp.]NUT18721.1 mandelate racemase/muconate lactonizing enzyme family protein [Hamadaea sp.]